MKCPKCQTENPEAKRFCRECGAELLLVCWNCGTSLEPEDKFCGDCGQKLTVEAAVLATEPVVDAERKQVTALFSDLSGYTAMTERLDPEDVKEMTSRIFDGVRGIVGKYEGFIERFAGDGVLALFGATKSHEDDPIRAIRAAREIHELVDALNPEYEAKVGAPLSMHSGINTGLAVTGDGDPEKGTHGVTGEAINIAARLTSLATAGQILVGGGTFHRAEGYFSFKDLGRKEVKGKTRPIKVYKVLSTKEQPVKTHRLSGLRAKLIGRKAEMTQLQAAVDRLKQGQGSIISVCGDGGTGKSRLVEEFKATLDFEKIQWREGHAYAYSQNIPYFPIIDLMNRAWRIDEGDPPKKVRETIETGVERLLGKKEEYAPYIGSLYSLSYPEIEEVSPEFWRSRLFEGMQAIVASLAKRAPTVFCIEDIHWADPSTLELLRHIFSSIKHPTAFVCVYRLPFSLFSDQEIRAMGKLYEEIRLRELSPLDVIVMLKSLLKTDTIPRELQRSIQDRVEGNPFYLEEFANSLLESGVLVRENGDWKLTRPLADADVPSTVQGVISARLDRLEKDMKRILQEASVIGRAFLYEVLKRITETRDDLDACLHGLERLDIVRARRLALDLEYFFKHALTQEVVYNGLLKKARQEIHERIGLVMERLFEERLPEFYETLAFHFKLGRSLLKAVYYLMRSGEKSLRRWAVQESHQYYQEAFDILSEKSDKTREEEALLIDLLIDWSMVFYCRADFNGLLDLLKAHENLAVSLNDKARLGMFYSWYGPPLLFDEKFPEAREILGKALALGEQAGSPRVSGYTCGWLTCICAEMGMFDEAIAHGEKALEIFETMPSDHFIYFRSLFGVAYAHWYRGDAKAVFEAGEKLLDFGHTNSYYRSITSGHAALGYAYTLRGDLSSAVKEMEIAFESGQEPLYSHFSQAVLGFLHLLGGQLEQAEVTAAIVLEDSHQLGTALLGTIAGTVLAVASVAKGQMGQGMKNLKELSALCLEHEIRCVHAMIEHVIGRIYLQMVRGEGDLSLSVMVKNIGFLIKNVPFAASKAEQHFNKAIEVAEQIGAKGTTAQAYLDLGRLHKAKKRKEKARECMSMAIHHFELCEAEIFLKQAREELESLE